MPLARGYIAAEQQRTTSENITNNAWATGYIAF